ncbi:unnamed protein product [Kuraishia capsulata CBS 1993]|uniref:mitogen-activated protein kinase kinase n=1 Tax=Kuraishia capsulata CBS 1993 TaxID=1382522 RepID=W6MMU3_9ASCO|nr:uncharacterized protein KUCA_T00003919001 [Kuraishia capsulata CBS 1993]CDK27939.1 unnamed protein product [Kuraishia capsulata CBS 1993]
MSEELNRDIADLSIDTTDRKLVRSDSQSSSNHSPLSYHRMPNIGADVQARVLAFQEKRQQQHQQQQQNQHSNCVSEPTTPSMELSRRLSFKKNQAPEEKPLPPLPPLPKESKSTSSVQLTHNGNDIAISDGSDGLYSATGIPLGTPIEVTNGNVRATISPRNSFRTKKPEKFAQLEQLQTSARTASPQQAQPSIQKTPSSSGARHQQFQQQNNPQIPVVTPQAVARNPRTKLSLSQRRGMKLNVSDLQGRESSSDSSNPSSASSASDSPIAPGKPVLDLLAKRNQLPMKFKHEPRLEGSFVDYSKYLDVKSGSLNFAGKASVHSNGIDFSSGSSFRISLDELEFIEELGRGNYGIVTKVLHRPTGVIMAMKEVRLELDDVKFRQILMELEILHNCVSDCIVDFYGAFFVEGAVYMCIEYMHGGSLDKIYGDGIPEKQLAYITKSVVKGLKQLKDEHNIIHRDVKPTNVLVNESGQVKLTDFGVSGNLVASLARTNIGCQSYMAPERIKSMNPDDISYSVQSDIWSLGLSILEMAKGCYPYPPETYDNIFSQLSAIVDGEPPTLPKDKFSEEAQDFVAQCLNKIPKLRPVYSQLLNHPWLTKFAADSDEEESRRLMAEFVDCKLKEIEELKQKKKESKSKKLPALHKGGANNTK